MARPSKIEEKRREFLPIVAGAFAEFGYRRVTSAELAARCGVGENVLYRIWPDKQAMFLAALEWVYDASEQTWNDVLADESTGASAFSRLLAYESRHLGEHGLHRIIFAGLSETDDTRIRRALSRLYGRFHALIRRRLEEHRGPEPTHEIDADLAAWAIVGLGTVANVGRELGLIDASSRRTLLWDTGRLVADARAQPRAQRKKRKA